jgi:chromosome segregation ATPase
VGQTNARLDHTNARLDQVSPRLESLESRVDFLEKSVSRGFDEMSSNLGQYVERLDALTRRQTDSELRLATEVLSLADVTREVRDLLSQKLDDHHAVVEHEQPIRALENKIADRSSE